MDPSHWTERTSAAISAAADAAAEAGHPQIEPLHVALAALEDANGVARAAVARAASGDDAAAASLRRTLARAAGRLPAVRPPPEGTPSASPALAKALRRAANKMKERGDTFLAVDTLWGACLEDAKVRTRALVAARARAAAHAALLLRRTPSGSDALCGGRCTCARRARAARAAPARGGQRAYARVALHAAPRAAPRRRRARCAALSSLVSFWGADSASRSARRRRWRRRWPTRA